MTDGLAGGLDPMSGDWHAGRGERIKAVVLAAISAALSVAGVNYPVDVGCDASVRTNMNSTQHPHR